MLPIDPTNETAYSFVVVGASGRLALSRIFPALWQLYRDNRLPQGTKIFTFCRTPLDTAKYRLQCVPYMGLDKQHDKHKYNSFWTNVHCLQGQYDQPEDYMELTAAMVLQESKHNMSYANRIFYLAIPPILLDQVTLNISRKCQSHTGWTRIIVEKPFARNEITYRPYQTQLCQTFKESQIYMIDHYLSTLVVQNFFVLRFINHIWSETWNSKHIAAVMISVKSDKPVQARANYFNQFGIIRDLMTNHMMQLLTLLTIDQPYSNLVDDLRDEKLKVLRQVVTVDLADMVLAQYCNNGKESDATKLGYTQHSYIPKDSLTPTFALVVLHLNNKNWTGVPFILRVGHALNETKTEIRVQYKSISCDRSEGNQSVCNELVLRLQPREELFMRMMLKRPGDKLCLKETQLNLMLPDRTTVPSNLQRLLLNVFAGNQMFFMRTDEQCEIWRIFSPVLTKIDVDRPKPLQYAFGSRGPMAAYRLAASNGFQFYESDDFHADKDIAVEESEQQLKPPSRATIATPGWMNVP
ncbi:CG7140 [Drosophila busckii]|uniref:Glucose-6-phosphate 1-dehydrogenase n=1 Tax=Drosophila busckii TaxID=30019 RepID=A0A0M4EBR0_DROBS|nr:glucose-6-phosphate 1-dehydrogenase [Drosophila busckii]ALC43117.1 Zw [Drosophila busckii]ALC44954.1 CG7140 [Drosophila busckii]